MEKTLKEIGLPAAERIGAAARRRMREEIEAAAGMEVFFVGRRGEGLAVEEVRVAGRGNEGMTPAPLRSARSGEMVIHNHPSGELRPSDADVSIAAYFADAGVGCYIVDNRVERLFEVVPPFEKQEIVPLKESEVAGALAPGGKVSRALEGFEARPPQVKMARRVAGAFNEGGVSLIEAGTGTGKSMAYLLPAILWTRDNKERVVVSTGTINLQEQLIGQDLPLLARALDHPFRAVLVKGRSNYACLRKAGAARSDGATLYDDGDAEELQALVDWISATSDGSKSDLSFIPKIETWEKVSSQVDQCRRAKCPHYDNCFYYRARRRASKAQVLVINHHLLMADLSLRRSIDEYAATAVLPPFHRIIIDEAHHLEEAATSAFSVSVSRWRLTRPLGRLRSFKGSLERGLLPLLLTRLLTLIDDKEREKAEALADEMRTVVYPRLHLLYEEATGSELEIGQILAERFMKGEEREAKVRLVPAVEQSDLWRGRVVPTLKDLVVEAQRTAELVGDAARRVERFSLEESQMSALVDLKAQAGRIEAYAADLTSFLHEEEGVCRWFELRRREGGRVSVLFRSAPISVATLVKEAVYERFPTVVMTSATLAVGRRFDHFAGRVGVALLEEGRASTLLLDSPFDFSRQAILAVPLDLPDPTSPDYPPLMTRLMLEALRLTGGRAFLLFTSYRLLSSAYSSLEGTLLAAGMSPMRQGSQARGRLLEKFRQDPAPVLFGTDSFWEGVDVRGEKLSLVMVSRLPFRVPSEPIQEARAEDIEKRGGSPFMELSLPQAVLRLKQGFGRLIRHKEDRGAVVILDNRVSKKRYGRLFIDSLPPARLVEGTSADVLGALGRFLKADERPL